MATKKKVKKKAERKASTKRGAKTSVGKTKKRNKGPGSRNRMSPKTNKAKAPERMDETPEQIAIQKALYVEEFAKTARNDKSAEAAGVAVTKAYKWCKDDEAFGEALADARIAARQVLEDAAVHRGVSGNARPIFQGKELVGFEQVYSDGLLQFVMKGADPEKYRDRSAVQHTGAGDGPIRTDHGLTKDTADFLRQEILGILK